MFDLSRIQFRVARLAVGGLCIAVFMLLAAGCGAARAGRFEAFAAAGTAYTKARSEFLQQSLETYIDRDSLELRRQHAATSLSVSDRQALLNSQDQIVRVRMEIVDDLELHGQVLRQYFTALSRLSASKEDTAAAAAAAKLSGELGKLSASLATKSIGGTPIGNVLGRATGFAVGAFRNRALARHLSESAATIDRELTLEEEALRLLAEEMIADQNALKNDDRRTKVTVPFRAADALPPDWEHDRRFHLLAQANIAKAKAAQDAARQLRLTFESLSKGENDQGGVAALHLAIERLSRFVGNFAASQTPKP
ncbi:MAG: hypothetical protein U5J83_16860 [Bryobacterales bacterium]|nr:hypothetical protein [Bryobacterales bacterium]